MQVDPGLAGRGVRLGVSALRDLLAAPASGFVSFLDAPITGTTLMDNPPRARSRGLKTPYAIAVAERQSYIGRIRDLTKMCAEAWVANEGGNA